MILQLFLLTVVVSCFSDSVPTATPAKPTQPQIPYGVAKGASPVAGVPPGSYGYLRPPFYHGAVPSTNYHGLRNGPPIPFASNPMGYSPMYQGFNPYMPSPQMYPGFNQNMPYQMMSPSYPGPYHPLQMSPLELQMFRIQLQQNQLLQDFAILGQKLMYTQNADLKKIYQTQQAQVLEMINQLNLGKSASLDDKISIVMVPEHVFARWAGISSAYPYPASAAMFNAMRSPFPYSGGMHPMGMMGMHPMSMGMMGMPPMGMMGMHPMSMGMMGMPPMGMMGMHPMSMGLMGMPPIGMGMPSMGMMGMHPMGMGMPPMGMGMPPMGMMGMHPMGIGMHPMGMGMHPMSMGMHPMSMGMPPMGMMGMGMHPMNMPRMGMPPMGMSMHQSPFTHSVGYGLPSPMIGGMHHGFPYYRK